MPFFLIGYIISAIVFSVIVFILSYNEKDRKHIKTVLMITYVLAIVGIIFATGCLEVKYAYSKLFSSILAAAIVAFMYGADALGEKLAKRNRG